VKSSKLSSTSSFGRDGAFAGARLAGVAGQRDQEHALYRPIQALHSALEVRGVGRQILHGDVQEIERGSHRPGQEILATVQPHLFRQAAERAVRLFAQGRAARPAPTPATDAPA
jgi:hypothetical protein